GRILLLGAVIMLCGRGVHHFFFGMHRPKVVTLSAAVGNTTNVVANYVLIFGEQGLPGLGLPGVPGVPAMGLAGAALGTVLGTVVELAIPAAIFLGPRMNRELGTRAAWRPSLEAIRGLFRIGWPGALQFGNEIVCWSIFMTVLVGRFGENHMTAAWVALGYMHLSFMPAVGLSVAVTSLVGRYIGAGSPDVAQARTRLGLAMALVYMSGCALVFLLFGGPLVSIFVGGDVVSADQAREIVRIGSALMVFAAVFQTVDALGIVYTGALRGAGDTVWPGVVTVVYSWLFIVAGGWAMTELWPQLQSVGPWVGASVYIFAFGITMAIRFESGRWRSIKLVEGEHAESSLIAPAPPTSNPDAAIRDIAVEIGEAVSEAENDAPASPVCPRPPGEID
ncbi:MAG: MATE family efflux transporter, partial [Thermoanaerobaculia bacterium]|nr:MATE family efflux transporter [Thermoanaerobaculia bacterium]